MTTGLPGFFGRLGSGRFSFTRTHLWALLGCCALAVVLVLDGLLAISGMRAVSMRQRDVLRAQLTMDAASNVMRVVDEAETGERGYVITGDRSYLEPYDDALQRWAPALSQLLSLTADDPQLQQQIGLLKELLPQRRQEMQGIVRFRGQNQTPQAVQLIYTGKPTMDQIRDAVAQVEDRERRIMADRASTASSTMTTSMWAVGFASLIDIGLLGLVIWLFRRAAQARELIDRERQAILAALGDALVAVAPDGRVLYANEAAARLRGYVSARDLEGKIHTETWGKTLVFDQSGRELEADEMPLLEAGAEAVDGALYTVRLPNGEERWVVRKLRAVRDAQDRTVMTIVTGEDVTVLRNLEQQRESLITAAAHDLKSPLTAIKGFDTLIERRLRAQGREEDRQNLRDLAAIGDAARRMEALIEEFLDVAHLSAGRSLDLVREDCNLVELARMVIHAQSSKGNGADVLLEAPEEPVIGKWDATRLHRVVENVIDNAIKYSRAGSVVTVRVSAADAAGYAQLAVIDHGIGIPKGELDRVFTPFYRAANVGKVRGSGIGLGYCRWVVRQHGGELDIQSQEGEGTTVSFECRSFLRQGQPSHKPATRHPKWRRCPSKWMENRRPLICRH